MSQLATFAELMRADAEQRRVLDALRRAQLSFEAIDLALDGQSSPPAIQSRLVAQTAKDQLLTLFEEVHR
jgi:hypothetical protein